MMDGSQSGSGPHHQYAVLLVAYGSPRILDEVRPYLLDVRGGRPTPDQVVDELRDRYAAIGGGSPLLDHTEAQARSLSTALGGTPVYVGMRHWHPYIHDTLDRVRADGHGRVVALALAPHFSRMSIGAYERKIEQARGSLAITMIREWYDHPGFLDIVAERVREGLRRFPTPEDVALIFTAHSLPTRILDDGDPYVTQLRASVDGVLERLGRPSARLAFQSAGKTAEPWLGPAVEEVLQELAEGGASDALVCPIGFVSDHLEILYDIDIELRDRAQEMRVRLERTLSLNDDPTFIAALASLVEEAARSAGWS